MNQLPSSIGKIAHFNIGMIGIQVELIWAMVMVLDMEIIPVVMIKEELFIYGEVSSKNTEDIFIEVHKVIMED